MAYTYILTRKEPPRIEELRTKKDVDRFLRDHAGESWAVSRCEAVYQYHVTYEHAHGAGRNTEHSQRVFARNAKDACSKIMEQYYDNLNALYTKRGTLKAAASHGVRYPYHIRAERMN